MEYDFKKVHTGKDLAISTIVLLAGAGLLLVNKGLGICIGICGLLMYLVYKSGYKKDGHGILLTRKSEDICKACRESIMDFLNGKDVSPTIKIGNEGGCIRLDLYYNKKERVAYALLYDFNDYKYEPATEVVEIKGDKADKLISLL